MANGMRVDITPDIPGPTAPAAKQPAPDPNGKSKEAPAEKPAERPADIPEKFWKDGKVDTEGLLKSYRELEKKNSSKPNGDLTVKKDDAPKPDDKSKDEKKDDKPADGDKSKDEKKDDTKQDDAEIYIPGVTKTDSEAYAKELNETGKLSDESYAKLAKAGYPKTLVDNHIRGIQAEMASQQTEEAEIKKIAGGQEGYQAMAEWMTANLDAEEIAEYDEAVTSGKKSVIKLAVESMHAKYKEAVGEEPNLLGGKGGTPPVGEAFMSRAEVTAAMRDPRYKTDQAYRDTVAKKLSRSKF